MSKGEAKDKEAKAAHVCRQKRLVQCLQKLCTLFAWDKNVFLLMNLSFIEIIFSVGRIVIAGAIVSFSELIIFSESDISFFVNFLFVDCLGIPNSM
jgi:hypothetical protein